MKHSICKVKITFNTLWVVPLRVCPFFVLYSYRMELYASPQGYLYNLHTVNRKEARKMWRRRIKEQWDNQCAYCGSTENLTIDHVVPKSKGGTNYTTNVVCSCLSCNGSKANTEWQEWYLNQDFFQEANKRKIHHPPISVKS